MADLIHLADEILVQIFSNLKGVPKLDQSPWDKWTEAATSRAIHDRNSNDDIRSLAHTCKRLHDLLTTTLYKHVSLISREGIDCFTFPIHCGLTETSPDTSRLFMSGTYLSKTSPHHPDDQRFNSFRRPGTSSVQIIHFTKCGLSEKPLVWVLSWPKALIEFYYKVDDTAWMEFSFEHSDTNLFSWASVRQALSSQRNSLETFVITQFPRIHDLQQAAPTPWHNNSPIDLSEFTYLRYLRSCASFVNFRDNFRPNSLPKMLEKLEIWYAVTPEEFEGLSPENIIRLLEMEKNEVPGSKEMTAVRVGYGLLVKMFFNVKGGDQGLVAN
ncbi:hypothetical protein VTL71DRAFT_14097 [Oculimacula yallundae]|uniref:F-box domain-containing protein n=1 Tax=Oculimacula yallundae TaxID=86028 RepID=A0ABR4CHM5_9HELO